jgi:hypothetical protein
MIKLLVKLHDRKARYDMRRDEEGLTMLAYALGAAVIIVPLAGLVLAFGTSAVNEAGNQVDGVLANT